MAKNNFAEETSTKTKIEGYLEIDHRRGVIYFHCSQKAVGVGYPATKLRLQGLEKPVTLERSFMIDVRSGGQSNA